jgi:ABC-type bacteriocin/lantibiotic exporter with double-glycine peptidase domain
MAGGAETIVHNWLQEMKIPASKTYIRQQLLSHPDYPSLLSITDTLDELGIENAAIQMEKDKLQDMPKAFLAHLNGNGGSFAMVNTRDKPENQFPGFFDRWGGVVVAAEKPENWQHKLNSQWLQKDKKQLAAVAATLLLLTAFILLAGVVSFNWRKPAYC